MDRFIEALSVAFLTRLSFSLCLSVFTTIAVIDHVLNHNRRYVSSRLHITKCAT